MMATILHMCLHQATNISESVTFRYYFIYKWSNGFPDKNWCLWAREIAFMVKLDHEYNPFTESQLNVRLIYILLKSTQLNVRFPGLMIYCDHSPSLTINFIYSSPITYSLMTFLFLVLFSLPGLPLDIIPLFISDLATFPQSLLFYCIRCLLLWQELLVI